MQPAFEATTTTAATAPTHEPTAASASLEEQEEENVDFDDQRMVEVLQRLADDAELHKLLSDEKMRCEIHRSNYEKIKAEYLRYYIITYHFSDPISFLSYDAFFPDPFFWIPLIHFLTLFGANVTTFRDSFMMVSEGIIDYNSLEDFEIQFHLLLHI